MKNRLLEFFIYLLFLHHLTAQEVQLPSKDFVRFEFSEPHMGTEFRILLYAADSSTALQAAGEAFKKIASLEKIMSDYREDSEVSLLAGRVAPALVSEDLWKVLTYAQKVAKRSNGAFDVTAGALTKLWRRAFRQKKLPEIAEIEAARKTTGYQGLELGKGKTVFLKKPGMHLDLGGIAKGYAVDEAMAVIRSKGITVALVDGGGDMLAGDAPPGTLGWLVEKPALTPEGKPGTEKIVLKNLAIATSGDTYKFLEHDGKRFSHIIDPRTGMGVTTGQITIVTAPTCMEADAWATAMSVEVNTDTYLWLKKKGIQVEIKLY